jgi:hypothetical protein
MTEKTLRRRLREAEYVFQEAKLAYDKASGARLVARKALEDYVDPSTGLRIKTKEAMGGGFPSSRAKRTYLVFNRGFRVGALWRQRILNSYRKSSPVRNRLYSG